MPNFDYEVDNRYSARSKGELALKIVLDVLEREKLTYEEAYQVLKQAEIKVENSIDKLKVECLYKAKY